MTVFLLGPAQWRQKPPVDIPAWIERHLPATWTSPGEPLSPLDLRIALAEYCKKAGHRAVVMEALSRRRGERHTTMFNRIEQEAKVRQHSVIWPPECKRAGLDIEIGNLLIRLERNEDLDVRIFPHVDAATVRRGEFVSLEKGNRFRYYSDLHEYGALIVPWKSIEELFEFVVYAIGSSR